MAAATLAPASSIPLVSPYVGLRFYTEDDAELFFGRDPERQVIMGNLRASRLTLLYAESGAGKSSLLRAGVAARLRELAQRTFREGGAACFVPAVFSAWKDDPTAELIAELELTVNEFLSDDAKLVLPRDSLRSALGVAIGALGRAVGGDSWEESAVTFLVILDQFEEYFLYGAREARIGRFADELAECIRDAHLQANFLISIREDAYSALGDLLKGRVSNVYGNYLHLEHLDVDAARAAIERPIDCYNRDRTGPEQITIEPGLVDTVLSQTGRESPSELDVGRHVETAYLQLVMERLWEVTAGAGKRELSSATLVQLGGPARIVRNHLERSLDALSAADQALAADAFRFMVTSSRTKIAHRARDLAEWTGRPESDIVRVLTQLAGGRGGRILRPLPPVPGETSVRYELFHDVLAEPIVEWRKQHEQRREAQRFAAKLEEDERKRLAAERARHQARFNRLVRLTAIALTALSVALAVAVAIAMHERTLARANGLASAAIAQLTDDPELSVLLARDAWRTSHTPAAEQALRRAVSASLVRARMAHVGPVQGLATSSDGHVVVTWGTDQIRAWRATDGAALALRARGNFTDVTISPDGRWAFAVGSTGARLYNVGSGAPGVALSHPGGTSAGAFSADATVVATVGERGVAIWSARSGRRLARLSSVSAPLDVAVNPRDDSVVAFATASGARLWNWRTGVVRTLRPSADTAGEHSDPNADSTLLAFSPNGQQLATAVRADSADVWSTRSGRRQLILRGIGFPISDLTWSPNGRRITAASGKVALIFNAATGGLDLILRGHRDWVNTARFDDRGWYVVTASNDGTSRVFDAGSGTAVAVLRGHSALVSAASFVGRRVVTGSWDGTARIWEPSTGREFPFADWVVAATFAPDGRHIATATFGGKARIIDLKTGSEVPIDTRGMRNAHSIEFWQKGSAVTLAGAAPGRDDGEIVHANVSDGASAPPTTEKGIGTFTVLRVAPGDKQLLVATDRGWSALLDVDSGKQHLLDTGDHIVTGGDYSHNGQRVVIAADDGVSRIFDARTGDLVRALPRHGTYLAGAQFSPDDRHVVTYGGDNTARVLDAQSGDVLATLRGHTDTVSSAAFSPDGKRIVTGSSDETLRIWDWQRQAVLSVTHPHADMINSVEFSPDGRWVLSASDDDTVKLTRCESCGRIDDVFALAGRRTTRTLSDAERKEFGVNN